MREMGGDAVEAPRDGSGAASGGDASATSGTAVSSNTAAEGGDAAGSCSSSVAAWVAEDEVSEWYSASNRAMYYQSSTGTYFVYDPQSTQYVPLDESSHGAASSASVVEGQGGETRGEDGVLSSHHQLELPACGEGRGTATTASGKPQEAEPQTQSSTPSSVPKEPPFRIQAGVRFMQGRRPKQEDRHVIVTDLAAFCRDQGLDASKLDLCPGVTISLFLSICLSVHLSRCLSVCLSTYLVVCLPIPLPVYLSSSFHTS
eukprot:GHVU01067931.1.p1 GENE.GHVU01067931.1~~GHVU01067931.1.p1  ORF type:complete len:259 (+),score=14.20 GHVU01067931.1:198-974(+)